MFNTALADQLAKLNLSPKNLKPRAEAQRPRCRCCNRPQAKCRQPQPEVKGEGAAK